MKVAALQMVSGTDLQANLDCARELLRAAAREGAEIALLPEYFCLIGQHDADKLAIQEPFGAGPIQHFLAEAALESGLWIVGGTLPISAAPDVIDAARISMKPPPLTPTLSQGERVRNGLDEVETSSFRINKNADRVYNSTLVFSPSGQCVARYDKMHLFRFDNGQERYDESRVLLPGAEPVSFELASRDGHRWRVGLSVCYDLRFPELYRAYSRAGADLLLVPSAFTHTTGAAHWEILLRARAIENLAFVAAAAQGGLHENQRRTWGHSMLIDPWGTVLAERAEGAGLVLADLAIGQLQSCRARLPALEHRLL